MNTNQFLNKFKKVKRFTLDDGTEYSYRELHPRMALADGVTLSVQASHTHYCHPRVDDCDYYIEVEIGYPSECPSDAIMGHAETPEKPTETVYGYVPVYILDKYIESHGGIVGIETFVRHDDRTVTKVVTKFEE